jgi:hypothetical protein
MVVQMVAQKAAMLDHLMVVTRVAWTVERTVVYSAELKVATTVEVSVLMMGISKVVSMAVLMGYLKGLQKVVTTVFETVETLVALLENNLECL